MADENFTRAFLDSTLRIIEMLDERDIEAMAGILSDTRARGGRVFFVGSGGGLGHASHAAADFRNIGGMETYCVGDNASELTALINDRSWSEAYEVSLRNSNLSENDALFVFSVGGGCLDPSVSPNLVNAIRFGKDVGCSILGVVGRDGGFLRIHASASLLIPMGEEDLVTAQVESLQALIWHLLVVHPLIKNSPPMWESLTEAITPGSKSTIQ